MRYRLTYALVALFAVLATLVPGLASAQGSSSISGTITSTTGKPVSDVCVYAQTRGGGWGGSATTGSLGTYLISGLTATEYRIRVSDCNYYESVINERYWPDAATVQSAEFLYVGEGEVRSSVDLVVVRTGSLVGSVKNGAGQGVESICVEARTANGLSSGSTSTNTKGEYRLSRLTAASYKLRFQDCAAGGEYMTEWHKDAATEGAATAVAFDPESPTTATPLATVLERGRRISGTVKTDAGVAVASACTYLHDAVSGTQVKYANTDVDGRYRFGGLAAGSYKVQVQPCFYNSNEPIGGWFGGKDQASATVIEVKDQDAVADVVLLRRGTLQGVVRDSNGPLASACVSVTSSGMHGYSGNTTSTGTYSIAVAPGTYKVMAYSCSTGMGMGAGYGQRWHPSAASELLATPVEVTSGQVVSAIDVTLVSASITGTVTDASGKALAGVCVGTSMYGSSVRTATDGTYTLRVNGGGTYELVFTDCAADVHAVQRRTVTVTEGQTLQGTNVTMVKHAVISGTVTDTAGTPLAGVCVNASASSGGTGPTTGYGYGSTGADGTYSIRPSAPGAYTVGFNPCQSNGQDFESTQVSVSATNGATTTANAVLKRRASISGLVVDAEKRPIKDVCVTSQAPMYASARTDAEGRFRMTHVAVGEHRLQFADCSGQGRYLSEWYDNQRTAAKATVVNVAAEQQLVLVETALAAAGRVAGVVTDETTKQALPNVCVSAHDRAGAVVGQTRAGADGTYVVGGLPSASYRIQFVACPYGMYAQTSSHETEWHANATSHATATPVTVQAGSTVPVDAALRGLAKAAGTVTEASGAGIAGICVTGRRSSDAQEFSFGKTDVNGDFASTFVPAGGYLVRYEDCATPVFYGTRWYPNATTMDAATPVELLPSRINATLDQVLQDGRSVTLVSPNGGETLTAGSVHSVSWRTTGDVGSTVRVELVAADGTTTVLTSGAPVGTGGAGTWSWTVPSTPADEMVLRVSSVAVPTIKDVSDKTFSVVAAPAPPATEPAVITVTAPNGGDVWARGTTKTITWTHAGAVGAEVKVELLRGTSLTGTLIGTAPVGADGKGQLPWRLAKTLKAGTDYRVRITSTTDATVTDISDGSFTIS